MRSAFTGFLALCLFFFAQTASAQFIEQQQFLGTGGVNVQLQGYVVDISKDGRTAVVGGYGNDLGRGAAWVFVRSGNNWVQQGAKLLPYDGDYTTTFGLLFGESVAISADGNTILVGGYADNREKGAAWVFTRNGTTWSQQGPKLVGTGTSGTYNRMGQS